MPTVTAGTGDAIAIPAPRLSTNFVCEASSANVRAVAGLMISKGTLASKLPLTAVLDTGPTVTAAPPTIVRKT